MLTLTISNISSIRPTILAPVSQFGLGQGVPAQRRRYAKPRYRFEIEVSLASRAEAEQLAGQLRYLQGDTPVWFDGADYGDIQNPVLVGYGTGTQTNYFLPHDNVAQASLVVTVNEVTESGWTLTESTGLLVFDSAPPLDAEIKAKYVCKFLVLVEVVGDVLTTYERETVNRYKMAFVLREIPQST